MKIKSKFRKKIISFGLVGGLLISSYAMAFASSIKLKDISNHWGKAYIENLINRGAINGYEDGTFRPDNNISNAEFTKILISSLGYKLKNTSKGHWASNYIEKAQNLGVLDNNEFSSKEDTKITRGQIAKMIVRAMGENYDSNIGKFKAQIKDFNLIPNSYQDYVLKAYIKGIITGYEDSTFKYERPATRAEASTMIIRMLEKDKRIVPELKKETIKNATDFASRPLTDFIDKGFSQGRENGDVIYLNGNVHIASYSELPLQIGDTIVYSIEKVKKYGETYIAIKTDKYRVDLTYIKNGNKEGITESPVNFISEDGSENDHEIDKDGKYIYYHSAYDFFRGKDKYKAPNIDNSNYLVLTDVSNRIMVLIDNPFKIK